MEEAEKSAKVSIKKVTVGIAGKHIRSLQHSDYIMRENPEAYITEDDIEQLKAQANKLVMLPGEEIIHALPQEYKVDSTEVQEPVGMEGKRLEAKFHVVVGQMGAIKNVVRCVKEAGLEMETLTLEPLASSEAVLTQEEKESGVAIVDIGGGTTDIAVFKDNIIRHTCVIPYGGGIVTEDIKEGCSIIEKHAEQLKVKFGSALPELEKDNISIAIPGLHGKQDKEISLKTLSKIINSRMEEILELVNTELKGYGAYERSKKLIAGIVLTGGGSNLKHLRQLANYITGFESRIGYANEYVANDKNGYLKGPEYATGIGLLMESLRIKERPSHQEGIKEPIKTEPKEEQEENNTEKENPISQHNGEKRNWLQNFVDKLMKELDDRE